MNSNIEGIGNIFEIPKFAKCQCIIEKHHGIFMQNGVAELIMIFFLYVCSHVCTKSEWRGTSRMPVMYGALRS